MGVRQSGKYVPGKQLVISMTGDGQGFRMPTNGRPCSPGKYLLPGVLFKLCLVTGFRWGVRKLSQCEEQPLYRAPGCMKPDSNAGSRAGFPADRRGGRRGAQ